MRELECWREWQAVCAVGFAAGGIARGAGCRCFSANRVPRFEALRKIRADRNVRITGRRAGMDITWLDDRIAVGGGIWNADNMAAVSRAGITHIIDMQIEFDDTPLAVPHGIAVCWNPVDDDFEPKSPEVFERGVAFALTALEDHGGEIVCALRGGGAPGADDGAGAAGGDGVDAGGCNGFDRGKTAGG